MKSNIIIFVDVEEGHIIPTFRIAAALRESGYNITYLAIPDVYPLIKENGFDCELVFKDQYPKGILKRMRAENRNESHLFASMSGKHILSIIDDKYDDLFNKLKPDLIISTFGVPIEATIFCKKYSIPLMMLYTHFPKIIDYQEYGFQSVFKESMENQFWSLKGEVPYRIAEFLVAMCEDFDMGKLDQIIEFQGAICCPKEFRLNGEKIKDNGIYLGPCSADASRTPIDVDSFLPSDKSKKLIYASMGSQVNQYYERAFSFFNVVIDTMRNKELSDYHLILAIGKMETSYLQMTNLPPNVSIYSWVPQAHLLEHISLVITNGGLGTIKESILNGIPQIVFPMGRDQVDNGKRVEHHNIGVLRDVDTITEEVIISDIKSLDNCEFTKASIKRMQKIFTEKDHDHDIVELVTKYIRQNVSLNKLEPSMLVCQE